MKKERLKKSLLVIPAELIPHLYINELEEFLLLCGYW